MSYLELTQNSMQMHVELCVYNHHSNTILCFRLHQAKRDALPLTPAVVIDAVSFPCRYRRTAYIIARVLLYNPQRLLHRLD